MNINEIIRKAKGNRPQPINKNCISCGKQLNTYHLFFEREKCSDCEPIYLLKGKKYERKKV